MPHSGPVDREALKKQIIGLIVDAQFPGLSELDTMSEERARRLAERVGRAARSAGGVLVNESGRLEPLVPDERPEPEDAEVDADTAKWREELAFFDGIREELAKDERYCGKYVAVKDKQVIDADVDEVRLTERIDEKFPDDVVLIAGVGPEDPVVELPSPEVAR